MHTYIHTYIHLKGACCNGKDENVVTPKMKPRQSTKRSKPVLVPVAFKLTLRSPAVEHHRDLDPYDDGDMDEFGELCDFWDGKQVTVHRSFSAAVSAGWAAVRKYVDDDEVSKPEFKESFKESCGGSWDWDGEHGGDLSVKISRTEAPDSAPNGKRAKIKQIGTISSSHSQLMKELAAVKFKLTLRSPAVEHHRDLEE